MTVVGLTPGGKLAKIADKIGDSLGAMKGLDNIPCNSFVPGTTVLMADGSTKPIEDVEIGDLVMATDPVTGETAAQEVTATIDGLGLKDLVDVTIDSNGDGEGDATVTATDGHPFWVADLRAWIRADDLTVGAWLRTSTGTWIQITAVNHFEAVSAAHNLTVNGYHTYYIVVGDAHALTHNCPKAPDEVPGPVRGPSNSNLDFTDGSVSPGTDWKWRGSGPPESGRGNWYNSKTDESLHPDLNHPPGIDPHWDYKAPDGVYYRIFEDGRILPKYEKE